MWRCKNRRTVSGEKLKEQNRTGVEEREDGMSDAEMEWMAKKNGHRTTGVGEQDPHTNRPRRKVMK